MTGWTETEVRCPVGFRKLFMRLRTVGAPLQVTSDNWMQFACNDCAREYRKQGQHCSQVFHYYAFDGQFMRTEVIA